MVFLTRLGRWAVFLLRYVGHIKCTISIGRGGNSSCIRTGVPLTLLRIWRMCSIERNIFRVGLYGEGCIWKLNRGVIISLVRFGRGKGQWRLYSINLMLLIIVFVLGRRSLQSFRQEWSVEPKPANGPSELRCLWEPIHGYSYI